MNDTKTEHTVIERLKEKSDEKWRKVKKLGSLLGDSEDMKERKRLASAALNDMSKIWLRGKKISLKKRVQLYNSLVKPILLYNCGTWGITKAEEKNLDAFHRNQIRKICKNSRLKNRQIYEICKSAPVSHEIRKARFSLFGHILRMDLTSPAQLAMK